MKKIFALSVLCVFLGACASQHSASNLSFVDVSLNYDSEDFDIVELEPVKRSASSIFGCTTNDESFAQLDRSTYIVGNGTSLGTATFLFGAAAIISSAVSASEVTQGQTVPIGLISTLLWGAYNDILWSNTVKNKAIERCNYSLVEKYPEMDAFINPKYKISWNKGLSNTTCRVTLSAQGIILKNKIPLISDSKTAYEILGSTVNQENPTSEKNEDKEVITDKKDENKVVITSESKVDTVISYSYLTSIQNTNFYAERFIEVAPEPSVVPKLLDKELRKFKQRIKRYNRSLKHTKRFEDFRTRHLILSEEKFEEYWEEFLKLE